MSNSNVADSFIYCYHFCEIIARLLKKLFARNSPKLMYRNVHDYLISLNYHHSKLLEDTLN